MMRQLQARGARESPYERPDRKWLCGWAAEGRPCWLGPDPKGRCAVTHECHPVRQGDRWQCTRSPVFGGACDDGPLSDGRCCRPIPRCQPVRSLRAQRGRLSRWTAALTAALLAVAIFGPGGARFISPGPVGTQHASIEGECSACHSAAAGGPGHWFGAAFLSASAPAESRRCLDCHNLGESSLRAHGVAVDLLSEKTASIAGASDQHAVPFPLSIGRLGLDVPSTPDGAIACATCHKEHRGRNGDLARMSNQQCQICHQNQFVSLSRGHPRFIDYPYARRTRIKFDHRTHQVKHFPANDGRDFSCIACHQPEPAGRTMELVAFPVTCGGCHDQDVRGEGLRSGRKGVSFINLPSLDLDTLRAAELPPLGEWPKSKRVKPGPFMDLLLSGTPGLSAADRTLLAGFDPSKLKRASEAEKAAVVRYAWAIKSLFYDIASGGHAAVVRRVERAAGRSLEPAEASELVGQISLELLATVRERWLPNLAAEVELYRRIGGEAERDTGLDAAELEELRAGLGEIAEVAGERPRFLSDRKKEDWVETGGWFHLERSYSVRYRSRGHADPFLRTWLDLSASLSHIDADAAAGSGGATAAAAGRIFERLDKKNAPGRCTKCHSVDRGGKRARIVNWWPFRPRPRDHPATQFRHQPHFSLESQNRCSTCHDLRATDFEEARGEFARIYEGLDAEAGFVSDFHPIESESCASCHTSELAGDACTLCHGYHLGDFVPVYLMPEPAEETTAESLTHRAGPRF